MLFSHISLTSFTSQVVAMKMTARTFALSVALICSAVPAVAQERLANPVVFGPYEYEAKPKDPEFEIFFPRKAPQAKELLLKKGDRLAICGDSITEQKMYSRMIETYLTVCMPELEITARQYGWSGEKTDGFLGRMDQDCLTFEPTIATLCYGMNDARYRPFDVTNGFWYRDHYTAIVRKFKEANVRTIVGSPGASGKIASWVNPKAGTLDEHNLNLCALRDIAIDVAAQEKVGFADVFWPMYQARVFGDKEYSTAEEKYEVAGKDGIHPGWAGQVIMAYAFLKAMGIDGNIGTIDVDLKADKAQASTGHEVVSSKGGSITLRSSKYPFCAEGPIDKDGSMRSGMTLVPFNQDLNRFTLVVHGLSSDQATVKWGDQSQTFTRQELEAGVNLADKFVVNPFSKAFAKVDEAVFEKQAYETKQVKQIFHGDEGKKDIKAAIARTEAERAPLAAKIKESFKPLEHEITITAN